MGILDKIGNYLSKFKVTIEPATTYRHREGGHTEEESFDVTIKKGNVIVAQKEFDTEKEAKEWSDNYIKKYGEMHRTDR